MLGYRANLFTYRACLFIVCPLEKPTLEVMELQMVVVQVMIVFFVAHAPTFGIKQIGS
jgi:hypothetical protein